MVGGSSCCIADLKRPGWWRDLQVCWHGCAGRSPEHSEYAREPSRAQFYDDMPYLTVLQLQRSVKQLRQPLDAYMGPDAQRLYQGAWQLVCVLARALEGRPPGSSRAGPQGGGESLGDRRSSGGSAGARSSTAGFGGFGGILAGFGTAAPDSPASDASSRQGVRLL